VVYEKGYGFLHAGRLSGGHFATTWRLPRVLVEYDKSASVSMAMTDYGVTST